MLSEKQTTPHMIITREGLFHADVFTRLVCLTMREHTLHYALYIIILVILVILIVALVVPIIRSVYVSVIVLPVLIVVLDILHILGTETEVHRVVCITHAVTLIFVRIVRDEIMFCVVISEKQNCCRNAGLRTVLPIHLWI